MFTSTYATTDAAVSTIFTTLYHALTPCHAITRAPRHTTTTITTK
jgi:hypothetical protein